MGIGELWRVVDWLLKQQNFDCRELPFSEGVL